MFFTRQLSLQQFSYQIKTVQQQWRCKETNLQPALGVILISQFVSITISSTSNLRFKFDSNFVWTANEKVKSTQNYFHCRSMTFLCTTRRECRFPAFCNYQQILFALFFDRRKRFFHEQRKWLDELKVISGAKEKKLEEGKVFAFCSLTGFSIYFQSTFNRKRKRKGEVDGWGWTTPP